MHDIIETVDSLNPLYAKQKEDVARMRAALLSCSSTNLSSSTAKMALKNITAMRIYHQIARIIKYLELMDKLEDKLYRSLENTIESMDENSIATWTLLLKAQESLQKQMIESHKLLQPYLDLQSLDIIDMIPDQDKDTNNVTSSLISADSREKLRNAANMVLNSINESETSDKEAINDATASE